MENISQVLKIPSQAFQQILLYGTLTQNKLSID